MIKLKIEKTSAIFLIWTKKKTVHDKPETKFEDGYSRSCENSLSLRTNKTGFLHLRWHRENSCGQCHATIYT